LTRYIDGFRAFYAKRAQDDTNLPEHLNEMKRLQDQLLQLEYVPHHIFQSILAIESLPDSWDFFTASSLGTQGGSKDEELSK